MKGRPTRHIDPDAVRYWRSKGWTYAEVCKVLGISYMTLRTHGLLDGRTAASYRPGYVMIESEVTNEV